MGCLLYLVIFGIAYALGGSMGIVIVLLVLILLGMSEQ
jgi:uncharacterized membrane protein